MQAKEFISKSVNLLIQIDSLTEEIKALKDEAKESELDVPALFSAARAVASNKVDALKEKSEAVLEAIEVARS
jgi:hypothetical protein